MTWRSPNNLDDVWNPAYIEDYIQYAEQDIEEARRYIEEAKQKLELIKSIEWKPIVKLSRRKSYATNRVEYYVTVQYHAEDDPKKNYYPTNSHSKRFTGTERKAAFEYAEKLAQELGAEIERSGFQ